MESCSVCCGLDFDCFAKRRTKSKRRRKNFRFVLPLLRCRWESERAATRASDSLPGEISKQQSTGSKSPWVGADLLQGTQQPLICLGAALPKEWVWSRRSSAGFLYLFPLGSSSFLSSNCCWRQGRAGQLRIRHMMDSAVQYSRGTHESLFSLLVVCFSPRISTGSPHHLSCRFSLLLLDHIFL